MRFIIAMIVVVLIGNHGKADWIFREPAKKESGWVFGPETKTVAAPVVAARTTFHTGHDCPSCHYQSPPRTGTWIQRGTNADGTHNHICPRCGTVWRH